MVATSHCWNLPHPPSSTFSSFRSSWVLSFSQCLLETFQKFQDSSTNLLSALKGVEPKARKAWFISWRCFQIPGPHKKWWKWTLVSLVWVKTFKHGCWSFHGTFCSPGFTMCSKYSYQKKVCKANESFRRGVLGWPGGWEKRPWCLSYLGSVQFWQSLVPEKSQSFIELKLPKLIFKKSQNRLVGTCEWISKTKLWSTPLPTPFLDAPSAASSTSWIKTYQNKHFTIWGKHMLVKYVKVNPR